MLGLNPFRLIERLRERLDWYQKELDDIARRVREIDERIRELSTNTQNGYLEYKWVLNARKKRYWYWYLRIRERDRLRSIYIGKSLPEDLKIAVKNRRELEKLARTKEKLVETYIKLTESLDKALTTLSFS